MPRLTSAQAFELAQTFHDLSVALGNYRFDNWDSLGRTQRKQLEDFQFDLLNDSTRFNAVSISGILDDLQGVLEDIAGTTQKMESAIKKIEAVGDVFKIATAAVTLGAAVVSGSPEAIVSALGGAKKALG